MKTASASRTADSVVTMLMLFVWIACPQKEVAIQDTTEQIVIQSIQSPGPTPIDLETGRRYTPTMLIEAAIEAALTKQHPMKIHHA